MCKCGEYLWFHQTPPKMHVEYTYLLPALANSVVCNIQSLTFCSPLYLFLKLLYLIFNVYATSLHPQNALGIRQFADTLGCVGLVESANKYIEHCFHEVTVSDEFLNLPVHDVQNLLGRNELRVERYGPLIQNLGVS